MAVNIIYVVYRAPAPNPGESCTGSPYDWLAWHDTGLQASAPVVKSSNSKWRRRFIRLVIWRSIFLFFWN